MDQLKLNVSLLRRRVPNLTSAARSVGLRPATVSNLCTGKIPIARAEVRTLVALASLAECSVDELLIKGSEGEMIETGIKVLDLFAPLTKGGTIGFVARPGMGQLVVLSEVLYRLKAQGYATVFLVPEEASVGISDVIDVVEKVCHSTEEVSNYILAEGKKREVVLAADRSIVLSGEIFTLQEHFGSAGIESVTTLLVDPRGEVVDEDEPYGPLDTLWQFDAELTARKMFPAIQPVISTSVVLEGSHLEQTHMVIQQRARKLLRRYRELRFLVQENGLERLPANDVEIYKRGLRLEAYFTQPFFVAEEYTKKKGETVSLEQTLKDVAKLLDGGADGWETDQLLYIGSIEGRE
ncbi:F0F1 ATP synthase subunit beta [Bacillus carboniphilus]|uniref:F0F1 ATP synthase subunit beta n=1 Tax=Bacillus carboniphilus TaxID=86663 RepID=A0ABN0WU31_9BACI